MKRLEYSSQKGGHCSQELMSSHKNGSPNRFGYPNSLPPLLPSPSQCDFFSIILMLSTMRPYTSIMLLYLYELRVRVSTRCAPYRPGMLTNNKQTKEANRQCTLAIWELEKGHMEDWPLNCPFALQIGIHYLEKTFLDREIIFSRLWKLWWLNQV